MKNLAPKLIALGAAGLVALALAETAARLLLPRFASMDRYLDGLISRMMASEVRRVEGPNADRELGFRLSPSAETSIQTSEYSHRIRTNSRGFRTRELTPRAPTETRLLLLGDSFIFGLGVEDDETVAAVLERTAGSSNRLSAYNYAVTGYNTVNEVQVARRHVAEVDPTRVLLGLYLGNDLICTYLAEIDEHGNYGLSEVRLARLRTRVRSALPWYTSSVLARALTVPLLAARLRYSLAVEPEILGQTLHWIQELETLCRDRKTPMSVVLLYPRAAVRDTWLARWTGARAVGSRLTAAVQGLGCEVLDTLPALEADPEALNYYYPRDGHLTPRGSRWLASWIHAHLGLGHPNQ